MSYRWPWKPPPPSPSEDQVKLLSAMDRVAFLQQKAVREARLAERAAVLAILFAVIAFLCQTFVILSRWGWL